RISSGNDPLNHAGSSGPKSTLRTMTVPARVTRVSYARQSVHGFSAPAGTIAAATSAAAQIIILGLMTRPHHHRQHWPSRRYRQVVHRRPRGPIGGENVAGLPMSPSG